MDFSDGQCNNPEGTEFEIMKFEGLWRLRGARCSGGILIETQDDMGY